MRIPRVTLRGGQVRTISCGLASAICKSARDQAVALARTPPDDAPAAIENFVDALADSIKAAEAMENAREIVAGISLALRGEPFDIDHGACREARDLALRVKAVREVAPEFEIEDVEALAEEAELAEAEIRRSCAVAWSRIAAVERLASFGLMDAIENASDQGRVLRALGRVGMLPPGIDTNQAFGAVADASAPEGSPANNTHVALGVLRSSEALLRRDREDAGAEVTEAIRQLLREEAE